jgi:thiosulfate dehydrogenase [quinone] large subunit
MLALARLMVGFIFLWAFIDKLFGLGFATASAKAWIAGGSPTSGFLKMGVNQDSPFAQFFSGLAGQAWVDWLFMLGLLGIGLALVLGIGLRVAAVTGTILLVMMWAAEIPLKANPVIDEHLVYATMLWVFAFSRRECSLTNWWLKQNFVKKNSWLW